MEGRAYAGGSADQGVLRQHKLVRSPFHHCHAQERRDLCGYKDLPSSVASAQLKAAHKLEHQLSTRAWALTGRPTFAPVTRYLHLIHLRFGHSGVAAFKAAQEPSGSVAVCSENANLTNAVVDRVDFDGSNMRGVQFINTVITGATFKGTDLTGSSFEDALVGYEDAKRLCDSPSMHGHARCSVVQNVLCLVLEQRLHEFPAVHWAAFGLQGYSAVCALPVCNI